MLKNWIEFKKNSCFLLESIIKMWKNIDYNFTWVTVLDPQKKNNKKQNFAKPRDSSIHTESKTKRKSKLRIYF